MSTLARLGRRLAPAGGLIAGYVLDRLLGDPQRRHPVAGFGLLAGRLEQRLYADDRRAGEILERIRNLVEKREPPRTQAGGVGPSRACPECRCPPPGRRTT